MTSPPTTSGGQGGAQDGSRGKPSNLLPPLSFILTSDYGGWVGVPAVWVTGLLDLCWVGGVYPSFHLLTLWGVGGEGGGGVGGGGGGGGGV